MTNDIAVNIAFYEELDRLLTSTPKDDKLFLLEWGRISTFGQM